VSLPQCHVPHMQFRMPNSNDMSDFTCQCTDTMVATCTSSFASAYLCAAVVCTCDWSDDSGRDDDETNDAVKSIVVPQTPRVWAHPVPHRSPARPPLARTASRAARPRRHRVPPLMCRSRAATCRGRRQYHWTCLSRPAPRSRSRSARLMRGSWVLMWAQRRRWSI